MSRLILRSSVSSGGELPSGVTLREIDGGSTYYADNGFTKATASRTVNGITHTNGWDSPTFFPIAVWFSTYNTSVNPTCRTVWADVGLNTLIHYDSLNVSQAVADGISVGVSGDGNAITTDYGDEHVMFMPQDEPANWADYHDPITNTTNARQDTRFWITNFTWQILAHQNNFEGVYSGSGYSKAKDVAKHAFTTPNATTRYNNIISSDCYWFTSSPNKEGGADWPYMTGLGGGNEVYHEPAGLTNDQHARGSNYGDQVDILRAYQRSEEGGHPAPVMSYIEYGDPWENILPAAGGLDAYYIRPHEFHWAWWSMIVHGVRGIIIFDHVWQGSGAANRAIVENPGNYYTTIQAGNSIAMKDQLRNDCQLTHALARIINADFALGYVTVSPAGYSFPTPTGGYHTGADAGYAIVSLSNGIEVMAKYYTGGSFTNSYGTFSDGFYIFACVRGSATQTSVAATFTIKNTGATQVTVVNESRTISVTGGGTTFSDTFADAYTVHIYKVG